jgi:hypothetical protein
MYMKIIFENFTTDHSESVIILLNCVLVKCCNDTIRSSNQVMRLCTRGGKHMDSIKLSVKLSLSPFVIRDVRSKTTLEVVYLCRKTLGKTRNVGKIGFPIKFN